MRVIETQSFPDERPPRNQVDTGVLFPYGQYVYFLTKENGGRRVMFGVVEHTDPGPGSGQPIEWFYGNVNAASLHGAFPRGNFFCRRYSPQRHSRFGVMMLDGLDDEEALAHLLPPGRR